MSWKSVADIQRDIARLWDKGLLLEPTSDLFPFRIPIAAPAPSDMASRLADIQEWYRQLEANEGRPGKPGYRLAWGSVNSRKIHTNRIPEAAFVDTCADALSITGHLLDAKHYQELLAHTETSCSRLVPWMRAKPLAVVRNHETWKLLTAVVSWFSENPRADVYLRQVDVAGVDTKFIERWRPLIAELLDAVLQPECIIANHPPQHFELRYGLRSKSLRIPVRLLDPTHSFGGLTDVSAPLEQLAALHPPADRVIFVENEITALSFPPLKGTLLIHGLGKAVEKVAAIPWLRDKKLWYWGDIDTHGIGILSRLRTLLPAVESILMDETTLLEHRDQWVTEKVQDHIEYPHLTPAEASVLRQLRDKTFGGQIRLEQERIRWGWALDIIRGLLGNSGRT